MKDRSIRKKITARILLIGAVMFLLTTALSYVVFVPPMRRDAVETARQVNTEIVQQMDSILGFVEDYTENLDLSVVQNQSIMQYFRNPSTRNQNVASLHLNNLISYEGLVRSVIIDTDIGPNLDSLNKLTAADYAILETDWYRTLSETTFGRGISPVYQVERNGNTYATAAYVKNFYHGNHCYTYTVFFELNDMLHDVDVLARGSLDYYALTDAQGSAFHTGGDGAWSGLLEDRIGDSAASRTEDGGVSFLEPSIKSRWYLVSFVSDHTVFLAFARYAVSLVAVLLVFLVTTLLVLSRALGNIVKPLGALAHTMETAAQGDLTCQVDVASDDEIGRLSRAFNKMIGDLSHSIQVIAEKEQREQQAKFSLLVSQIDPHFIYNTINSINYLARKGRCDDVITVNSALITILRDRLRVNDIQITDTVANEMRVLDQYLVIQKYMYEGALNVVWQVDESLLEEQIPKNMIQPLVENALFHGLIDEENGDISGEIIIRMERRGGAIAVQVQDDGQGMDAETLQRVRSETYSPEDRGKKIGLSNIRGRLYYLYGSRDCLQIDSAPYSGTCVTLTFPQKKL